MEDADSSIAGNASEKSVRKERKKKKKKKRKKKRMKKAERDASLNKSESSSAMDVSMSKEGESVPDQEVSMEHSVEGCEVQGQVPTGPVVQGSSTIENQDSTEKKEDVVEESESTKWLRTVSHMDHAYYTTDGEQNDSQEDSSGPPIGESRVTGESGGKDESQVQDNVKTGLGDSQVATEASEEIATQSPKDVVLQDANEKESKNGSGTESGNESDENSSSKVKSSSSSSKSSSDSSSSSSDSSDGEDSDKSNNDTSSDEESKSANKKVHEEKEDGSDSKSSEDNDSDKDSEEESEEEEEDDEGNDASPQSEEDEEEEDEDDDSKCQLCMLSVPPHSKDMLIDWVDCDGNCGRWFHVICILRSQSKANPKKFVCPSCRCKH